MKIRMTVVVLCLLALALPVLAQDKPKENAAPGMGQAEMEAMMKAMTPGEPHKHLAQMAGDWTFTSKTWMAPNQPPMESGGTMHAETLLDGRYVQAVWKGDFMGMPFEGRGTEGYDNVGKQYFGSWIDNFSTGMMYSTGKCDDMGKSCAMSGSMMDPISGKQTTMRTVRTWMDNSSFKLEMYGPDPSGSEMKMMEMMVKRK